MRRSLPFAAFAAFGLLASVTTTGHAVDLPLSYVVAESNLKLAVAGTVVTFELHDEPTCAVPEDVISVPIENIVSFIERLKTFTPKGLPKLPKMARLNAVLSVTPPSPTYLRVTGTGIQPMFSVCQVQLSAQGGTSLPCASQVGNEVTFSGCNVNIRNGAGSTGATNGLGNLVVGYNEATGPTPRTGSHNLVVGQEHAYSSSAGLIVGKDNYASGPNVFVAGEQSQADGAAASVSGGFHNFAGGNHATVSGGKNNQSDAEYAAVSGGEGNVALGLGASITGGQDNEAQGDYASITGGESNIADGTYGTVTGGIGNVVYGSHAAVTGGFGNAANGSYSTVASGRDNAADGEGSFVGGGRANIGVSPMTSVLGGQCNRAGAGPKATGCVGLGGNQAATVTGGFQNLASGNHSSVNGGNDNTASGGSSVVGGGNTVTQANGFGWSAGSAGAVVSGRFVSP